MHAGPGDTNTATPGTVVVWTCAAGSVVDISGDALWAPTVISKRSSLIELAVADAVLTAGRGTAYAWGPPAHPAYVVTSGLKTWPWSTTAARLTLTAAGCPRDTERALARASEAVRRAVAPNARVFWMALVPA